MAGFFKGIVDAVSGATSSKVIYDSMYTTEQAAGYMDRYVTSGASAQELRSEPPPFRDRDVEEISAYSDSEFISLKKGLKTRGRFTYLLDNVASGLAKGLSAISQATRDPNLTRSGVLPFRDEYRSNTRANTNDTSYVSLRRESSNTVGRFTYQLDNITNNIPETVSQACTSVANIATAGVRAVALATVESTMSGVVSFQSRYIFNVLDRKEDEDYVSLGAGSSRSAGTIARYTYTLDRYRKNLMLILHVSCYEGSVDTVTRVKTTFEQFRFQVELHHDQTGDEMRETCHKFFQQDFTEYGAVAVVVVAPAHEGGGEYRCRGSNFRNDDVLRYFWGDDVPATLGPKPKIFLSQADNEIVKHSDVRPALPLREEESHVYELFLPATIYPHPSSSEPSGTCHPLNFLCEKLEELGDRDCFQDIAKKTIREAKERWPSADGRNPGSFDCTDYNMMRSLTFWRTS